MTGLFFAIHAGDDSACEAGHLARDFVVADREGGSLIVTGLISLDSADGIGFHTANSYRGASDDCLGIVCDGASRTGIEVPPARR